MVDPRRDYKRRPVTSLFMTCLSGKLHPHQVAAVGSVAYSASRPTVGELTSSKISGSSPGRISATTSSIVYFGWQERTIAASPSIVRSTARPSWTRRLSATALGIRIARLFPHWDTSTLMVNHFKPLGSRLCIKIVLLSTGCPRRGAQHGPHFGVEIPSSWAAAWGAVPHGYDHPYPTQGRDHPQSRPCVRRTRLEVSTRQFRSTPVHGCRQEFEADHLVWIARSVVLLECVVNSHLNGPAVN